jgi:hypothetical protein
MNSEQLPAQDVCGCCDGVNVQAPMRLYNRPGLSAVAYRIGTHSEILASLLARMSSQDYPALAKLRTRDSDDFSIALLDAYACIADILSFYQERLINEAFLRTAGERRSLSELARLIGYRLKPGVAAETYLAFTLQEPPPQPASSEPKQASGVPDQVTLQAGIQVQSIPGPDEKPQTFEAVEAIEARSDWNRLQPQLTSSHLPAQGDTGAWLQGTNLNIKAGDGLILIGNEYLSNSDKTRWQFRVINRVTVDSGSQATQVSWATPLDDKTPGSGIQGQLLRRRAAVFGNNAPRWATMPKEFKDLYEPDVANHSSDWPDFLISPADSTVDLDGLYSDIKSGHWAVLTTGASTALFSITAVSDVARDQFALAGKVTRLALAGDNYATLKTAVRSTTVYSNSEPLTFAEAPIADPVVNNVVVLASGDEVVLDRGVEGLMPGRKMLVAGYATDSGRDEVELLTLKLATMQGNRTKLSFEVAFKHSYQLSKVSLYANVAKATHGETVHQILGSGAAGQANQRFVLKHVPLTFTAVDNESGAAAALEVRVNDIQWKEAPTLYPAGANDRSYVLRVDENGAGTVRFGDGRRGARLPTGQDNVRTVYRKGIGMAGNLKAGQLCQLLTRPLGLKGVSNPLPAAGGVDPERSDNARRNMPLGVRTLGRVVSVQDYEDYARAYAGIAKAQARVLITCAGRTVFITVAGDRGLPPAPATLDKLRSALQQNGDPLVHCQLAPYNPATFNLALRIKRDPAYEFKQVSADVAGALRAAFAFDARDFGQIVARSEVIAVAQAVDGVVGVDLDYFYRGTTVTLDERLVPAVATVDSYGNAMAAELLLLDPGPLHYLEEMP